MRDNDNLKFTYSLLYIAGKIVNTDSIIRLDIRFLQ